jgi:hypothetical protein
MNLPPDLCSALPFGQRFIGDAIGVRDPQWPGCDLSGGVGTAYTSLWAVREALREHHIFGFVAALSQPKPAEFNPHLRVLFVNAVNRAQYFSLTLRVAENRSDSADQNLGNSC